MDKEVHHIDVSTMSAKEAENLLTTLRLAVRYQLKCPRLYESLAPDECYSRSVVDRDLGTIQT